MEVSQNVEAAIRLFRVPVVPCTRFDRNIYIEGSSATYPTIQYWSFRAQGMGLDSVSEINCSSRGEIQCEVRNSIPKVQYPKDASCQTDDWKYFLPKEVQPSSGFWKRLEQLKTEFHDSITTRVEDRLNGVSKQYPRFVFTFWADYNLFKKMESEMVRVTARQISQYLGIPYDSKYYVPPTSVEMDLPNECAICLQALFYTQGGLSPCHQTQHACHRVCLNNWHSERVMRSPDGKPTCPMCRECEPPTIVTIIREVESAISELSHNCNPDVENIIEVVRRDIENNFDLNLRQIYYEGYWLRLLKAELQMMQENNQNPQRA